MSTDDASPAQITFPAISVILLADLLTDIDEFLRSSHIVADDLAEFLRRRRGNPSPDAFALIDQLSFAAATLRALTTGIDKTTAEHTRLADVFDLDYQPGN